MPPTMPGRIAASDAPVLPPVYTASCASAAAPGLVTPSVTPAPVIPVACDSAADAALPTAVIAATDALYASIASCAAAAITAAADCWAASIVAADAALIWAVWLAVATPHVFSNLPATVP